MAFNLIDKVTNFLKNNENEQYTSRAIAKHIYKTYREDCEKKQKKSKATKVILDTEEKFTSQLVSEIGASHKVIQAKEPNIKIIDDRSRKFYYTIKTDAEEVKDVEETIIKESDLYPIISEFLWSEFRLYSKRIDEKSSNNTKGKNGNKWLHPDLVAFKHLSKGWHETVKACVETCVDKRGKLWSFEVKSIINLSNIRESFLQTISNSS